MSVRCEGCFKEYSEEFDMCPYCGFQQGSGAKEVYFLQPGTILGGKYIIGNSLGFGGFGITYKAWDQVLESAVAIKEYYPSGIVNRQPGTDELILFKGEKKQEFDFGLVRFIDEARNMTRFNVHENIVNVFEYFEENNTAYIVMEFLDGQNLNEYMNEINGKLPLDYALDIIFNITNALKDVHLNGIIHRDISPDNIFLCNNGKVKLIDFGAARFSSQEEKQFTIILKPGFAPPEQYEQISDQGPKTDIYALGATLYYMVTGVKPDESTNRKIQDVLEAPSSIDSSIPQYINDSILSAMAIEPALRFESVDDFEKSLRKEIKVTAPETTKKKKKRKRFAGISALACVLLAVGLLFMANVKKKSEMLSLKPADISVWYAGTAGGATDKAYKSLVDEFKKEYPDVKVDVKCIAEDKYGEELKKAFDEGKAPNLFMSNGVDMSELSNPVDLRNIVFPESVGGIYFLINVLYEPISKSCYFLNNYDHISPDHFSVPASFNLPVIYINKSNCASCQLTTISSFDEIEKYITADSKMIVSKEMSGSFKQIFGKDFSANIVEGTKEDFLSNDPGNKYAFYYSDTSEFFDVRKMAYLGVGVSGIIGINIKDMPCSYGTVWSVNGENADQNKASKSLLEFFLSSNAQSVVYGKSDAEKSLPINKDSIGTLSSVYEELGFISDVADNCVLSQ